VARPAPVRASPRFPSATRAGVPDYWIVDLEREAVEIADILG
jgi:hypothetical protein